tara:strand:+ start:3390 stop:4097 length:708 start_codon:yes stop_codon:yes gene_type:complete
MGANKSVVISFSIAILLLLSLLLLLTYNSKCNNTHSKLKNRVTGSGLDDVPEPFYFEKFANSGVSVADNDIKQRDPSMASSGIGNYGASEANGNEIYDDRLVNSDSENTGVSMNSVSGGNGQYASYEMSGDDSQNMQSCYPRDRLTADDLLPKDAADSKWAQINPSGGGALTDQNYLTAGYHVGVNTVGQSLRNANLQLRSEIPNPQNSVGPWLISTIEPDLRQNTLEIGSSPSY